MTRIASLKQRAPEFREFLARAKPPIWRPWTGRELAEFLGVTVQDLANWRVRNQGPEFAPAPKGCGNKILYRPSAVLSWLSGTEEWTEVRDWLVVREIADPSVTRSDVEWIMANVE